MAGPARARVHSVFKVKAEGRARLIVFDTQDLSVGRAPDNDLSLDEPEMSRHHCVFLRTPQGCGVKDLGTANGTSVNGEAASQAVLKTGDVVRVGEVEIAYAETARDPATLGKAIEYASQLKAFSSAMPAGGGEATVLGLGLPFEADAGAVKSEGLEDLELYPSRDLDAELLDLEDSSPGEPEAIDDIEAPDRAAADEVWELDEADPALDGLDLAAPPGTGALVLRIELRGLDGELRRSLQGLVGKTVELANLRLQVESDD